MSRSTRRPKRFSITIKKCGRLGQPIRRCAKLWEWATTSCCRAKESRPLTSFILPRPLAGCVLVSGQESWIGAGSHGSTATMTAWQEFVKNQVRLQRRADAGPKLACSYLQPYVTTQAPDRSDILNV